MKKYLKKPLVTLLVTLLAVPIYLFSSTPEAQAAATILGGGTSITVSEGNSPVTLETIIVAEGETNEFTTTEEDKIKISISTTTSSEIRFAASTVIVTPSETVNLGEGLGVSKNIPVPDSSTQIEIELTKVDDSKIELLTIQGIKIKTTISGESSNFVGHGHIVVTDAGGDEDCKEFDVNSRIAKVDKVDSKSDDGLYKIGDTINFQVQFSEEVKVSGMPKINVDAGVIENRYADYSSGSGTSVLEFRYIIAEGDNTNDFSYLSSDSLVLNGGKILNLVNNTVDLVLPSKTDFQDNHEIKIDGIAPRKPTIDPVSTPVNAQIQTITGTKELGTKIIVTGGKDPATVEYDEHESYSVKVNLVEGDNILRVNAIDLAGNLSETATATITTDSIPPAVPQNSTGVVGSDNIKITWDGVDDAVSYQVWRSASPYTLIATLPAGTTEYIDYDVIAGTTYYYKIIAIDSAGNGSSTDEISVYFPTKTSVTTASVKKTTTTTTSVTTPPATTAQESTGEEQEILDEETTDDQGVIKGDTSEESEDEEFNWTPWIILIVIVALAGAATGGYFYWTREEEILPKVDVTVSQPKKKSPSKTTSGKNKSGGKGSSKQRW